MTRPLVRSRAPRSAVLALVSALVLGACGDGSPTEQQPRGADSLTTLPRALSVAEREGIGANNQFALQLLRTTSAGATKNVLLSPLSVSYALGLTMNGAAGQTLSEMQRTLGWGTRSRDEINVAYRDLRTLLPTLDSQVTLTTANGVFSRQGFPPDTGFVRLAREYFGAPVQTVATPQQLYDSVNAWGGRETKGMVPKVLEGNASPDLVMILANAVYFAGTWRDAFDAKKTTAQPFTLATGQQVSVPMMQREDRFNAYATPELEAAELPYGNASYSMVLVKPRSGSAAALAASLDTATYQRIVSGLRPVSSGAQVHLPRFTVRGSLELSGALRTMGMSRAFTNAAEFPQLVPTAATKISFVQHGVALEVDEAGTRAAAVTAVGIRLVSLPLAVRFDAPFVFFIRERLSGTILFAGVVNDPRS